MMWFISGSGVYWKMSLGSGDVSEHGYVCDNVVTVDLYSDAEYVNIV